MIQGRPRGRQRWRRGANPSVVSSYRCQPLYRRLGALPGRGCLDADEICSIGFTVAALWVLWLELRVEEVATMPSNNLFAACCFLAPPVPVFPLRSPAGLSGEGSCGRSRVSGGSRGSRSSASSVCVRGASGMPAVSALPSSPLPTGLDG
jgi:hypothetical protein